MNTEERSISSDMESSMNEVWKPIEGYEGYFVSNLGNVRSYKFRKPRLMSKTDNGNGYELVGLCKGNVRTNYYVHRLVAQAFVENPLNLPQVNHKDYNRKNNRADNLEWLTALDNTRYSNPNMHNPKKKIYTKTGQRYITMRGGRYRVIVKGCVDRQYKTLEEAIKARNEAVIKMGWDKWFAEEMGL